MFEFLPEDVRRGLEAAQRKARRRASRLSVQVGATVVPILSMGAQGFSVEAVRSPALRGLVDIYDGPRHLSQALIIAVREEGGEMHYEYKSERVVSPGPARDYAEERERPAGYLGAPA